MSPDLPLELLYPLISLACVYYYYYSWELIKQSQDVHVNLVITILKRSSVVLNVKPLCLRYSPVL